MNTKTGRFVVIDSVYPEKSPSTVYETQYQATLVAGARNGQAGYPRRFIVREIGSASAQGRQVFASGAL